MKLKNIPNILSTIRILLVFVFVLVLFVLESPIWAIIVFLVAGLTDVVDGFLARRYNWITNLGKILDPLADKMMQCTVLICLCIKQYIPIWFIFPFFAKEAATVIMGLVVIKRRNVVIVSKWYGKAAVCMFYATIVASVCFNEFFAANRLLHNLICAGVALFAVGAFAAYTLFYYSKLKNEDIDKGTIRNVIK